MAPEPAWLNCQCRPAEVFRTNVVPAAMLPRRLAHLPNGADPRRVVRSTLFTYNGGRGRLGGGVARRVLAGTFLSSCATILRESNRWL
jgi:hypothetical protein